VSPYYGLGTAEEILANLETVLNTVTGIQFVDYQRIEASGVDPSKYPGCFINSVSTDKERLLKDLVKNAFGVSLILWIWAKEDEDLATKMNLFIDEVKGKVMTDPTRNDQAYDSIIENVSTDAGSRHPQGMCIINMAITFYSEE